MNNPNKKSPQKISKLLIILIIVLFVVGIVASILTFKYYRTIKNPSPKTSPSATSSLTPAPTATPTPTASPTITYEPSVTPTPVETETPISYTSAIPIVGDEICKERTNAALAFLQKRAPEHYEVVLQNVGLVECADQGSGIFVWEDPPRYRVGEATSGTGNLWYAGTFPHEACHTREYRDGREYLGELAETECLNVQYDALEQMGADQGLLDYVKNQASTKYWEVPYEDRWW